MLNERMVAAGIAVLIALLGIVTGLKWLTVAAFVLWIVAMIILGTGNRQSKRHEPPPD